MSGKPGQLQRHARRDVVRQKVWQAMRILIEFTHADLMRCASAKEDNVRKYSHALAAHGYLRLAWDYRRGSRSSRVYRLIRNPGPEHPLVCAACGQPIMSTPNCLEASHD